MAAERLTVNQEVYYFDAKKGWLRGTITAIEGDKVTIDDAGSGKPVTVVNTNVHGYIHESYDPNDEELFHVSDLHVATLLYCIKDRFEQMHRQYSLMGEMVLSVNPFQVMPFNNEQERKRYLAMPDPRPLPAHIWQIAHKAYNAIVLQGLNNQSVVISGESGSGKTENTKSLIAYLGQLSYMHSNSKDERSIADRIDESLTWSNPVMESFGNARTVRNDNSSRFGKYIKLYFDTNSGIMIGGETVTYLLEKSRLILQAKGERNYHIFYEMLAGLSPAEKANLGNLKTAQDYRCLCGGETFTRRGVDGRTLDDAAEFRNVRQALRAIGVSDAIEQCILRVLSAILHLMEVDFSEDDNDKAVVASEAEFQEGARLLGVDPEALRMCFLIKSQTKIVTIQSGKTEAESFRNAFCKGIYVGLFDRLVEFVNKSITPQGDHSGCKYIGLLDIFGFENFQRNSFEQLCINYANESLQNHYNKYTFINDEEECKREGIQVPKIVFPDNSECVGMLDQKTTGVFSMLDEECNFKGGTAARFTQNAWEQWTGKSDYFVRPKSTIPNQFGINHYAASVLYNTDEWLEKNTDGLKEDMYACLAESSDEFIGGLLSTEKSQARRKQTVAIRFRDQLKDLRGELESTETQFVRCIKPNNDASPDYLDNLIVGSQLESAGVLQTIALKRQGYPVRRPLEQFCRYFYLIMPSRAASFYRKNDFANGSTETLNFYQRLYQWPTPNFAVGKTKVFLRAEVWSALERLVLRRRAQLINRCNPYLRRWIAEYRERKRIEEEKRQAEMKKKREEREAKAAANADGLPAEKIAWVEEFSNMFPDMDADVLMDIAAEADSEQEALEAVLAIQKDEVDRENVGAFVKLMEDAEVRDVVTENFMACDVKTVLGLSRLKPDEMKNYGCNDVEVVAIVKQLGSQHAKRQDVEKLDNAVGTNAQDKTAESVKANALQRYGDDFECKVRELKAMGYSESDCRVVLAHYNGDVQRTAARLLYGVDRKKMNRNVRKHKDFTTSDMGVQRLIGMGASKTSAKAALRKSDGDIDAAARMLFKVSS